MSKKLSLLAAFVLAIGLVSCGGGSEADEAPSPSASPTVSPQSTPTSATSGSSSDASLESIPDARPFEAVQVEARVPVDEVAYYAGFMIEISEVRIGYAASGLPIADVRMSITNQGDSEEMLRTAFSLGIGGTVTSSTYDNIPTLAGGAAGEGNVSIPLGQDFDVDHAILLIGRSDRNHVSIPLGSDGELVTLTPIEVSGPFSASDEVSTVTVESVTARWDNTFMPEQSEPRSMYLIVRFSLESSVATAIEKSVTSLLLPSGNGAVAIEGEIISLEEGETSETLQVQFPIEDPPSGTYTFTYTERFGRSEVDVMFDIP